MTFDEVMQSNIRPKCEPKITVSGTDINGDTKTIIWNAKDIKSLTFKRSIDPVGRNLPIMELQWTEVYYGKFNAQNFPIKYNNVAKYMAVTLEFDQSLSFFRTWKDVKSLTWKSLLNFTWKSLKTDTPKQTIKMPMMFLSATPEISGKTIKWTAKDALSFLTENQVKAFYNPWQTANYEIPFYNPIIYLLVNARATFYHSKELFDYYTRTINYFNGLDKTKLLTHGVIFDGATNSEIMNYLSPMNEYLDFDSDKIIKKEFTGARAVKPTINIPLKLQYGTPTAEVGKTISRYSYKQYIFNFNYSGEYEMSPTNVTDMGSNATADYRYMLEYLFNGYGTTQLIGDGEYALYEDINRAIDFSGDTSKIAKVTPLEYKGIDQQIILNQIGELYEEDNTLNIYNPDELSKRQAALTNWYQEENHIIKNQTPAMFNWELGTFANCETLMYNDDGTRYVAPSMLIEYTMEYNGAIKQSNIAHEIKGLG